MKNDTVIDPQLEADEQFRVVSSSQERETTVIDMEAEMILDRQRQEREATTARSAGQAGGASAEAEEAGTDDSARAESSRASRLKKYLGSLISGNILSQAEVSKHFPYMLFLAVLTLLYISNVFYMQQLHHRHDALTKEVKDLRSQSMTVSSIRMNSTRQSSIVREVERRGLNLKESLSPPKVIGK